MKPFSNHKTQLAFTLLELLIVIVIMGALAAVVTPQIMTLFSGAKSDTANLQIETLVTAVNYFQIDTGQYPSTEQGLHALVAAPSGTNNWRGPYVRKPENLRDPWGRDYRYVVPGIAAPFDIYSFGADNREGGEGENRDVGITRKS